MFPELYNKSLTLELLETSMTKECLHILLKSRTEKYPVDMYRIRLRERIMSANARSSLSRLMERST